MKTEYKFYGNPVPGLLSVYSNVRRISSFSLCPQFQNRQEHEDSGQAAETSIHYAIGRTSRNKPQAGGKTFTWKEENRLDFNFQFLPFLSLSISLTMSTDSAFVNVCPRYHRFARISIGNIPSAGWLIRDIACTILAMQNKALLYAAAVELEGKAIVIAGLPNSGKTTLVQSLVAKKGARVLGDDLIVIDSQGLVHPCPFVPTTARISRIASHGYPLSSACILGTDSPNQSEEISADKLIGSILCLNRSNLKFHDNSLIAAYSFFSSKNILALAVEKERKTIEKAFAYIPAYRHTGDRKMQEAAFFQTNCH